MARIRLVRVATAVASALALVTIALPAGAAVAEGRSAPVPAAPEPDPAILEGVKRDLGLTDAQARARLAKEHQASVVEPRLRAALGQAFGGLWLSPDASVIHVGLTDPAKAALVRAEGAEPVAVRHSERKLNAAVARLDARKASAPASIAGWYADVTTNSVVVLARDAASAQGFVGDSVAEDDAVRVVPTAEQPQLYYDVRGGDAYYTSSGSRCSVGFSVTRGTQGGFVTAGHCGRVGTTTTGYNRVAQGTFQGSSFPGNDYAWVAVNSQWIPRPWVNNYSGGNIIVRGSAEAAVGASVCRSGSTTGYHCGTIQAKNQTVRYAQGTVTGLTRTTVCAEPGDSGGSYISNGQAQGVTSGGSGNCRTGGTTFFQPVNEILGAYGLRLVTG
ncbi:S1 family peptidase [Bailinhaonella thermotolerans]|uniref:S1 family peptidase n=1 Tax=Bailinhaonella thermotolerans TaxID=1070861 RepID=A0A3A4AMW3_9ACTN|nr:S1 family peptidase [Bailinhaonella thermotolerans]RJL27153.1 S1 family peptidase [Bailinhaonella thermotolerans]